MFTMEKGRLSREGLFECGCPFNGSKALYKTLRSISDARCDPSVLYLFMIDDRFDMLVRRFED